MITHLLDANIFVRFLVKDDPVLTAKAIKIFSEAGQGKILLYLDEVALAETIWVIHSFYKIPKTEFLPSLIEIVAQDWFTNPRKELLSQSLKLYQQTNFSYIDCWLYILSKKTNYPLETFDKKLKKLVL